MLPLYRAIWNALRAITQQQQEGQNSAQKKQKSVSAYCWVKVDIKVIYFNLKSMFTMCSACLNACWDTAAARRRWTEQWRDAQVWRRPLPNRTEFINFFWKRFNQRRLQFPFANSFRFFWSHKRWVHDSSSTHACVIKQKQRELVDFFTVDKVQDAPDKQLSSAVTITSAIFIATNNNL